MLRGKISGAVDGWTSVWAGALVASLLLAPVSPGRASEALRVEFSELAEALPWDEMGAAVTRGRVRLLNDGRESIGPGARWAETLVELAPADGSRRPERLHAVLWDVETGALLCESEVPVTGARALVRADLRGLRVSTVRLHVELRDADGGTHGAGETWLTAAPAAPLEAGLRIPLRLDLPEGAASVREYPVTFGAPMPAGALWSAEGLRLVDGKGRELPSQLEAAGLWAEDGSVKWLWVNALVSGGSGDLALEKAGRTAASEPATPVNVVESDGRVVVDTGVASYAIVPGGALVEEVRTAGRRVAGAGDARGLYVVDQRGRSARASTSGAEIQVESRGPISAVLRIEGDYLTDEGEALARHITRLHFAAGRPEARAVHTLLLTRDSSQVWFREIGWEFEVAAGGEAKAVLAVSAENAEESVTVPLSGGKSARIIQEEGVQLGMHPHATRDLWWDVYPRGRDRFAVRSGDALLREGERLGDWALLTGAGGGWLVSCRRAAAQHPKEFELSPGRLNLRLYSPGGGQELDFRIESLMQRWGLLPEGGLAALDLDWVKAQEGWEEYRNGRRRDPEQTLERLRLVAQSESNAFGWSKTHEILLSPLSAAGAPAGAGRQSRLHSERVFVHLDPAWVYETRVLGRMRSRDRERFPVAETILDRIFDDWLGKLPGAYTGFVDYYAGPHYCFQGRYHITYTFRPGVWRMYARTGNRALREMAQGSSRANRDNWVTHCGGPDTLGFFNWGTYDPRNTGTRSFPLYWAKALRHWQQGNGSNHLPAMLDYYLSGWRRAGEVLRLYAQAVAANMTPTELKGESIVDMRLVAQVYEFTWNPKLRALVEEISFRHRPDLGFRNYDPEGELLISKKQSGTLSSTYKMEENMDAFVELGDLLGSRRSCLMAATVGRFMWDRGTVIGRASGLNAHRLWEVRRTAEMAAGFDFFRRVLGHLALDPETGAIQEKACRGFGSRTKYFLGLPLAMDVVARTDADRRPPASWLAFQTDDAPISVFFRKPEDAASEILVRFPSAKGTGDYAGGDTGGAVILKPHAQSSRYWWAGHNLHSVREVSVGFAWVRAPKDAPGGVYEVELTRPGEHSVFADRRLPLALHAPDGWRPAPLNPPLRVYFRAPETGGRAFFENGTRLYTPSGEAYRGGEEFSDWVDLPGSEAGLWAFESRDPGLVRTEGLPAFFALGDPEFYLEYEAEPGKSDQGK